MVIEATVLIMINREPHKIRSWSLINWLSHLTLISQNEKLPKFRISEFQVKTFHLYNRFTIDFRRQDSSTEIRFSEHKNKLDLFGFKHQREDFQTPKFTNFSISDYIDHSDSKFLTNAAYSTSGFENIQYLMDNILNMIPHWFEMIYWGFVFWQNHSGYHLRF